MVIRGMVYYCYTNITIFFSVGASKNHNWILLLIQVEPLDFNLYKFATLKLCPNVQRILEPRHHQLATSV